MIVVRFKMRCRSDKVDEAMAALQEVIAASRPLSGVLSFDIGRDLADPDSFVALEVFEDRAALERQESLPATQRVIGLLPELIAAPPETTIYDVSASEPG